jgi:hypothetical protein
VQTFRSASSAVTPDSLGFVLDALRRDLIPLPMVIAGSPLR